MSQPGQRRRPRGRPPRTPTPPVERAQPPPLPKHGPNSYAASLARREPSSSASPSPKRHHAGPRPPPAAAAAATSSALGVDHDAGFERTSHWCQGYGIEGAGELALRGLLLGDIRRGLDGLAALANTRARLDDDNLCRVIQWASGWPLFDLQKRRFLAIPAGAMAMRSRSDGDLIPEATSAAAGAAALEVIQHKFAPPTPTPSPPPPRAALVLVPRPKVFRPPGWTPGGSSSARASATPEGLAVPPEALAALAIRDDRGDARPVPPVPTACKSPVPPMPDLSGGVRPNPPQGRVLAPAQPVEPEPCALVPTEIWPYPNGLEMDVFARRRWWTAYTRRGHLFYRFRQKPLRWRRSWVQQQQEQALEADVVDEVVISDDEIQDVKTEVK